MKKLRFCLYILFLFINTGFAQLSNAGNVDCITEEIIIGTGTMTTYQIPVNMYYCFSYTQQIFDASEIGVPSGLILAIAFEYISAMSILKNPVTIYLGNTTKSTFASASDWVPVSQMTQVFTGAVNFYSSQPWFTIVFDNAFQYTGGNIVVAVLNNTGTYSGNSTFSYHTTTENKTLHFFSDHVPINPGAVPLPSGTIVSNRNNVKFTVCDLNSIIFNTQADFSCPGQVTVTYDLVSDQPVNVTLYYSHNQCDWLIAQTVTGDLFAQTTGTGKTIIWYNYTDNVRFGKFYFKVEPPIKFECIMIMGVCWATRNVDMPGTFVAKPEDAGMFYQWGSNVGWSSTDPLTASDGINIWRNLSETGNVWLPEKKPCPQGWRVPTLQDIAWLTTSYVTSIWDTENGINGLRITEISTGNTLFLPAVGSRNVTTGALGSVGNSCFFWSSTPNGSSYAYLLRLIYGGLQDTPSLQRNYGFSVRCVKE